MAATLVQFDTPIHDEEGRVFYAKACGHERDDGLWEAWLEFENRTTGEVLRSSRETTQPNLKDLRYWATGVTPVYLEGGLARALHRTPAPKVRLVAPPTFGGPAEPFDRGDSTRPDEAILNPFSVYAKSPELLARELAALRGYHLRAIVRHYDLAGEDDVPLESLTEPELGVLILQRVRERETMT